MLDINSFRTIKQDCIIFLSKGTLMEYRTPVENTIDIYQLLCFILSQLDDLPNSVATRGLLATFKALPESIFSRSIRRKQELLLKLLQNICNKLMSIKLEITMKAQLASMSTLEDWKRNVGRTCKVNDKVFSGATDISMFRNWLEDAGVRSEFLKKLIIKFANQNYWLQPLSIIQEPFYSWQKFLLLDSDVEGSEPEKFYIVSRGFTKLIITTERYFYRLMSPNGTLSALNPPCSFTMKFEVNIVEASPVVSNFSMTTNNLPSELMHPARALSYYFLEQYQSSPQPSSPEWVWSAPTSPTKDGDSPQRRRVSSRASITNGST